MSPNIPPAFEHLPAEIHGNILRQMASPEDVYSTIRASPTALGAFLCFREEIFEEYLGLLHIPKHEDFNYVPNERYVVLWLLRGTMKLSTLVYEAETQFWTYSELEGDTWEGCNFLAWCTLVNSFLWDHFEKVNAARSSHLKTYGKPKTSEKAEVNYIMSTYGMLKRFIRQYQLFVRGNMAHTSLHLDFDPPLRETQLWRDWSPLSESETFRLHRGFLRYEIYCRITTVPDRDGAKRQHEIAELGCFNPLSDYLDNWEAEEVQCIQTYVETQYQGVARNVVEDFCCDVWRHSRKAQYLPDSRITKAPEITPADETGSFLGWIGNMSYLGLSLLQQVLRSGVDDQRHFLKNTNLRRLPPYNSLTFLEYTSRMDFQWHRRANQIYNSIALASSGLDDANFYRGHSGWLYGQTGDNILTALRHTGWVFWEDRSRSYYFSLPRRRKPGPHISHYIDTWRDRDVPALKGLGSMGMSARYPEVTMCVAKEDYQELMDKYAAKPAEPDAEYFLLDRLREISDWSSKEVSPAFQEICSVTHAMD